MTSQRAHSKYDEDHMPLNENPPMKIFCVRHWRNKSKYCDIPLQANHQVDELKCKIM